MPNTRDADRHISAIREFTRFYTQKIGVLRDGLLDSEHTLAEARVLYEIAHRERPLASAKTPFRYSTSTWRVSHDNASPGETWWRHASRDWMSRPNAGAASRSNSICPQSRTVRPVFRRQARD